LSRLQPTLTLKFPSREDEKLILNYHLPFVADDMLAMTVDFLQKAHELKLDFSTRDGINLLRYAVKRMSQESDHPLAVDQAWREALEKCLGEDAIDLERLSQQRQQTLGGQALPMGFGDFFFSPEDPLHPDLDLDDDDDED
ncbi:MAG: ATPase, partial [Mariniblastus sp.]|nr:ATPase [Mariniblastus sp.]